MTLHPDVLVRSTCRLCNESPLVDLFSLGEIWVSDFVEKENVYSGVKSPIEMVMCERCSLPQLRHTAPSDLLYRGVYHYRSSVTRTMRDALRDVTATVEQMVPLGLGSIVLDIGSNDGTLLRSYSTPGIVRVGVEPAKNLADQGRQGVDVFLNDFWSAKVYEEWWYSDEAEEKWGYPNSDAWESGSWKPKVITCCGMLYDLERPNDFIADVAKVLAPDGIFVAQLMCARQMLASNDIGNLCAEHLLFFTLRSLDILFAKHGLEIFDATENEINGGSYRLFVRHASSERTSPRLYQYRIAEYRQGLHHPDVYQAFFERAEANKKLCVDFVKREYMAGKRIWFVGASTKGSLIAQFYGLDSSLIEGASERSPEKVGKVMAGLGVPIFSEEDMRKAKPEYAICLPYAFEKEIMERERAWLEGGGRMILPLPTFRVIGKEALSSGGKHHV